MNDLGEGLPGDDWDAGARIKYLEVRIAKLEAALRSISTSKFNSYEFTGGGSYGIGVCDGHRYCTSIANDALNSKGDK